MSIGQEGNPVAGMERKSFDNPDETRQFVSNGQVDLVTIADGMVGRATFAPGWKWSEHVKPIAGTDSCQASHLLYVLSGRTKAVLDDGTEMEAGPGDVAYIPAGHDGWTVGDEPCVVIDFAGMASYAQPG
jgi:quercetin dioxygenase-like cupin family protein